MSRRPPNPAADRAAQNQQTLKTLVKIESNKSCADCKRNKHPRWASWNLGIFVCIRCSGIHRGMGTHISRVKSVDLDAWTDEQLQSMIRWGNARANKYWEAKLALGHIPAEAKIENFIRTKYDTKRWVMDGGLPDPSTLDTEEDEHAPAEVVREPPKVERSGVLRGPPPGPQSRTINRPPQHVDLIGDESLVTKADPIPLAGPSTKPQPPPKTDIAAQRLAKPADSLLGFDFFGSTQAAPPPRPSSAAASNVSTGLPSRPDLKQSILSLYASGSRTATPTPVQNSATGPPGTYPASSAFPPPQQTSVGGLDDAFGSLTFGSSGPQAPPRSATFNNLASPPSQVSPADQVSPARLNQPVARGNFFDSKQPSHTISSPANTNRQRGFSSSSGGFGDFASAASPGWGASPPQASIGVGSNMHVNAPAATVQQFTTPIPPASIASNIAASPFNLSSTSNQPQGSTASPQRATTNAAPKALPLDAWGSSDVWASSNPNSAVPNPPPKANATTAVNRDAWGWGEGGMNSGSNGRGIATAAASVQPAQITRDEDFGGWESSAAPSHPAPQAKSSNTAAAKPGSGFGGGGEDLFSNVWE